MMNKDVKYVYIRMLTDKWQYDWNFDEDYKENKFFLSLWNSSPLTQNIKFDKSIYKKVRGIKNNKVV